MPRQMGTSPSVAGSTPQARVARYGIADFHFKFIKADPPPGIHVMSVRAPLIDGMCALWPLCGSCDSMSDSASTVISYAGIIGYMKEVDLRPNPGRKHVFHAQGMGLFALLCCHFRPASDQPLDHRLFLPRESVRLLKFTASGPRSAAKRSVHRARHAPGDP
jgi:hypothetical protein